MLEGRLSGQVAIFGPIAQKRNIIEKNIEQKLNTIEFMEDSNAFITLIWLIYNLFTQWAKPMRPLLCSIDFFD